MASRTNCYLCHKSIETFEPRVKLLWQIEVSPADYGPGGTTTLAALHERCWQQIDRAISQAQKELVTP